MSQTDIAIVGAGPAGLSAAINGKARGKTVRVLSGERNNLEKASRVDNYLGYYQISGSEMMANFSHHAQEMGIVVERGRVANILPMGNRFLLNFNGELTEAATVVLATGAVREREIPGERELLGQGVSYCATCDGRLYRGKTAVVWGLSRDAAHEANFLHDLGVQVLFVSDAKRMLELQSDIPRKTGAVSRVTRSGQKITVFVEEGPIEADGLFILRDAIAPATLLAGLQTRDGFIQVNRWMETNLPGAFAAGDCTGKPLQVSKAVGEGLIAAQRAAEYVERIRATKK